MNGLFGNFSGMQEVERATMVFLWFLESMESQVQPPSSESTFQCKYVIHLPKKRKGEKMAFTVTTYQNPDMDTDKTILTITWNVILHIKIFMGSITFHL